MLDVHHNHSDLTLLSEPLPIFLTTHSARDYVARCAGALSRMGIGATPETVRIAVGELIAKTKYTLDGVELQADAIRRTAEALDDDVSRAYALVAWCCAHSAPQFTDERVAHASRILQIAEAQGDQHLVQAGYLYLFQGLLEQGRMSVLDTGLLKRRADLLSAPVGPLDPAGWFSCLRSILDGEVQEAEAQAQALYDAGDQTGTESLALYTIHLGMIRWMQGTEIDAEQWLLRARRAYPEQLFWQALLARHWIRQGRHAAAASLGASFPDLDDIPRDFAWLATMTVLADIASHQESRTESRRLRELLLPYAHHLVPAGTGVVFWGTVARALALVEEQLGMLDEAREHFELAVMLTGRIGALAWHAEAQIELATFALRHGLTEIEAYELLSEARATARARNFYGLERRTMHRPRICVLGQFEVVSMCGIRADWNSRKARELLKMLVAARGIAKSREVYMDALWPNIAPDKLANRFSVAVNTIRRALDPGRLMPTQHFIETEDGAVRIRCEHVEIDIEMFLALSKEPSSTARETARKLYRGEAFAEEPYADWATDLRHHAARVHAELDSPTAL